MSDNIEKLLNSDFVYKTNNAIYWIAVKSIKLLQKLGCIEDLEKELDPFELMNFQLIKKMRLEVDK